LNPFVEVPKVVIEGLDKIFKEYKNFTDTKKPEEKTRSEEMIEYWGSSSEKLGNIYEHNYITRLINGFLQELQEKGHKKNVLIIDDLDRMDPEHIFRILNILSVHNNNFGEENKFAFDHLIVVCDIENIKRNFEHKYGVGVDFEGYIDKYFSTDIFDFINTDAIKEYVSHTFKIENNTGESDFLEFMFQNLIDEGSLSLRKLMKHKTEIDIEAFVLHEQNDLHENSQQLLDKFGFINNFNRLFVESTDLTILRFFKLMSVVYGDFKSFHKSLLNLQKLKLELSYTEFNPIISFLVLQHHIASEKGDDLFFEKFYLESINRSKVLRTIKWPENSFANKSYKIHLKWKAHERYNSDTTYFQDAKVFEAEQNDHSNNTVSIKELFKYLNEIILACKQNKYLEKINIFLDI